MMLSLGNTVTLELTALSEWCMSSVCSIRVVNQNFVYNEYIHLLGQNKLTFCDDTGVQIMEFLLYHTATVTCLCIFYFCTVWEEQQRLASQSLKTIQTTEGEPSRELVTMATLCDIHPVGMLVT